MSQSVDTQPARTRLNVRFEESVWNRIDALRSKRAGFVSRNSWILEAVMEKLSRESAEASRKELQDDA